MTKLRVQPPEKMDEKTFTEIYELTNRFFVIDPHLMNEMIRTKDVIHLYYDRDRKLVGTFGFKWVEIHEGIFLYLGNAVIDERYQKAGLLTKSLIRNIVYTYAKYPRKAKYVVALSTTPQAYSYFTVLNEYWPRSDRETPSEVLSLLEKYMIATNNKTYYKKDGLIRDHGLYNKISARQQTPISNKQIESYFKKINPEADKGEQVLCLVPFNVSNFMCVIKVGLGKKIHHSKVYKFVHTHVYMSATIIAFLIGALIYMVMEVPS